MFSLLRRPPFWGPTVAALCALLALAAPASAITYGQLDEGRHPFVGATLNTFEGTLVTWCSGTLISPTVFLTAAHCDVETATMQVIFSDQLTGSSTIHTGTWHVNPAYRPAQSDSGDLAVVVFPAPIAGITPAQLPTLRRLDAMRASGALTQGTRFTAVGYGGQETTSMPGGHVITFLDRREFSVSSFNSLGPGYLRLSQNPQHGDGGTCNGDSGGPNFFGAGATETTVIAAVTITGDPWCKATNVALRLDTPSSRAFLSQYVTVP
jgi:secreted trypsin-like serine protease